MRSFKLSAGVIVVRLINEIPHFLLLRVYNYWDFPKGEVEPGEQPLEAAIREVNEETGLADLMFRWGHGYVETAPYGRGKIARYYLAESNSGTVFLPVSPELGHPEHHEYRWLPYLGARLLLGDRLKLILTWAEKAIESGDGHSKNGA